MREREGGVKEPKRDRQLSAFEQSNVNFIKTAPQIEGRKRNPYFIPERNEH